MSAAASLENLGVIEPSLISMTMLLRFHGVSMDIETMKRAFVGKKTVDSADLIRFARRQGLKARAVESDWTRLPKLALPALARDRDGNFFILAGATSEKALIQHPAVGRPQSLDLAQLSGLWDGALVLVTRRSTLSDFGRRFDIGWFVQAMHKYRWVLGQVLIASFFLQVFGLISPLFFQVVVDKVLVHRGLSTLDVLVIGLIGVSVFETILGVLRTYAFSHTTNRIDVELGARLFRHLLALPLDYFGVRRVGDSVARVRELENIRQFITSSALTLVIDLLFTVVFLAVMAWYSWTLTLIVLVSLPFYAALSLAVAPLFKKQLDERFRKGAENQAFLVEVVTSIETLKSMAVEPQMESRWEEQLAGYVKSSFDVTSLSNYASQSIQLISKLVTAATLYFGARAVISNEMTVGELVAFNMLAGRVAQPVLRLAQLWQDFHQTKISIQRLGDILNTPVELAQGQGRVSLPSISGNICFEQVRFRYRFDGPEILKGIDLEIKAGQCLGIVGLSGSGKSTLAKLTQRLYSPEGGRVLVDGVDLRMAEAAWLRRQIGVVLQESVLFNRTVQENIALTDPGTPFENVVRAAKLAGAHDFILELSEGYNTVLGERGGSLSGGQRQRIAIARALLTDPRILIFDEATSALDYESELVVQRNMRQISAGRTVLIIAHRLSTVRGCDRIITMESGRIVEEGTHEDLIRGGGRYSHLYQLQLGLTDAA